MSYRILRITDYYGEFLNSYYLNNSDKINLDYHTQYNEIVNQSIEIVSSYEKYMKQIGIDAIGIISNAEHLQKRWAKEHDISGEKAPEDIVVEQIKFYKPDIVWIDTTRFLTKKWISHLKTLTPNLKLVVGHICAPYNDALAEAFKELDIVFTCSPCTVKELKSKGIKNVELVYHSFNHSILDKVNNEKNDFPNTNVLFTGSLLTGFGFHNERIDYLEKIINSDIEMSLFGNLENRNKIFLKRSFSKTIRLLESLNFNNLIENISFLNQHKLHASVDINYYSKKLLDSVEPPVFGLDMFKVLAKSDICFNIHGDVAKKCAGNLRLFEATGVGSCLVTDWKENMSDLFDLDNEVVTYKSPEECIDKIKWLVNNPIEMNRISKAGQDRTLKDHTVQKRVLQVNEILSSNL
jgi:hypothetical protein